VFFVQQRKWKCFYGAHFVPLLGVIKLENISVKWSFVAFLLAGSPPFRRKVSSFGGLLGWAEKDRKFG